MADRTWDHLPSEIHARVMAATAHASVRRIEHELSSDPALPSGVWTVDAVAGDRFVHQVLALREDGSVFEATRSVLAAETEVSLSGDESTVEVPGPSGTESIPIPENIARALDRI